MKEKINDIKEAVANKAFQSALALALTLPDICGEIEYPTESSGRKRYAKWCDNYFDFNDCHVGFGTEKAELNGDLLYALRCAFLHSVNDDLLTQPAGKNAQITKFSLLSPDQLNGYGYQYKINSTSAETSIVVDYLIDKLCSAAENYYDSADDKSVFESHNCTFK